ncbi:hypothetical protein, partial [Aestuariibaculum marinum]|uniref:hypothetical protein n=1 Tax=Aestuariibaculum marinum TaxID=2683592 RepID=UPI0019D590F4
MEKHKQENMSKKNGGLIYPEKQDLESFREATQPCMGCICINRNMNLSREHVRAVIYYVFKIGLSEQQSLERLQLAFDDESPLPA